MPPSSPLFENQQSSNPDELRPFAPLEDEGGSLIFLLGIYAIFGAWLVRCVAVGLDMLFGYPEPFRLAILETLTIIVTSIFSVAVLWICTRRYLRCRAATRPKVTHESSRL